MTMAWTRSMTLADRRRSSNNNVHPRRIDHVRQHRRRNHSAEQQQWKGRDDTPVRDRAVVHRRFPNSIQCHNNNNNTTEGHILMPHHHHHRRHGNSHPSCNKSRSGTSMIRPKCNDTLQLLLPYFCNGLSCFSLCHTTSNLEARTMLS